MLNVGVKSFRRVFSLARPFSREVGVIQTTTNSIYTTTDLDPEYNLSKWSSSAKTLFSMHPSYIHPQEMNYGLPTGGIPEFAFVGRSNVGKSSLIDHLMGNRKIVRVSKEPGCTRSINYYGLSKDKDGKSYGAYFVDLPGYGFAKKSKEEQTKWTEMIHNYVSSRDQSVLRYAQFYALFLTLGCSFASIINVSQESIYSC